MRWLRLRSCRRIQPLLLLALALLPAGQAAFAATPDIILQTQEQRPWTLPADLERVAISNPDVADLITLRNRQQALLVGRVAGNTTLLLWRRGEDTPQRLQIEVRGAVQSGLQPSGASTVTVQGAQALIGGSSGSLLEHRQAHLAADAALDGAGSISDVSTIATGGVVQVEVKIVEFNRSILQQIGLNFQNRNGGFSYSIGSPGVGGSEGGALSSAFNLVFSRLGPNGLLDWSANVDLLHSNGLARVLAEPTLVALSGQSASFLAGGELPILEPQGLGTTTIAYKPFGVGLTVSPTVLANNRIALKVAPEASDLDYTNAVTLNGIQVPAISTRRADTTVELGDGESFVIGGLVSSNLRSTVDKIPLLGDLPIIGSFFRNLNYAREEKELVIVVTPRLVKPLAAGTQLPLPGQREAQPDLPVWGSWLLYPAGSDQLPGFSR